MKVQLRQHNGTVFPTLAHQSRWNSTSSVGGHHWNHQADVRQQLCQFYHQCVCKVSSVNTCASMFPVNFFFLHSCTRLDLDPAGLFNSSLFSCYIQILAGRLSTYGGGGHLCQPAVQGANGSPIYGQVCYFCKDE